MRLEAAGVDAILVGETPDGQRRHRSGRRPAAGTRIPRSGGRRRSVAISGRSSAVSHARGCRSALASGPACLAPVEIGILTCGHPFTTGSAGCGVRQLAIRKGLVMAGVVDKSPRTLSLFEAARAARAMVLELTVEDRDTIDELSALSGRPGARGLCPERPADRRFGLAASPRPARRRSASSRKPSGCWAACKAQLDAHSRSRSHEQLAGALKDYFDPESGRFHERVRTAGQARRRFGAACCAGRSAAAIRSWPKLWCLTSASKARC